MNLKGTSILTHVQITKKTFSDMHFESRKLLVLCLLICKYRSLSASRIVWSPYSMDHTVWPQSSSYLGSSDKLECSSITGISKIQDTLLVREIFLRFEVKLIGHLRLYCMEVFYKSMFDPFKRNSMTRKLFYNLQSISLSSKLRHISLASKVPYRHPCTTLSEV